MLQLYRDHRTQRKSDEQNLLFPHGIEVCVSAFYRIDTCVSNIFFNFRKVTDYVISEHNTLNFLEYSLYCLRKPSHCKSINYKARKHRHPSTNCQLNNVTKITHPQNLLSDKNYDFYVPLEKVFFISISLSIRQVHEFSYQTSRIMIYIFGMCVLRKTNICIWTPHASYLRVSNIRKHVHSILSCIYVA